MACWQQMLLFATGHCGMLQEQMLQPRQILSEQGASLSACSAASGHFDAWQALMVSV